MRQFIIRRLLLIIPTLILVSLLVFAVIRLIPGDVVELMLAERGYAYAQDVAEMRHKLGLDKPIHIQYVEWAGKALRGDLGQSLWTGRTATAELASRFPVTLELAFISLVISLSIAIPVGIYSAIRQDSTGDYIARTLAIGALAIPGFWLATLIVVLPSIYIGWSPPVEFVAFPENPIKNLSMFILPAICLGLARSGQVMRITRTMMLEVLRQDYIRTAWSKGLRERGVIVRHALKNALIPVVTMVGIQIPIYIGGSVIMESIFGLPGVGSFMLEVITHRDYPMLSALNFGTAFIIVFVNLIVDVSYGWLDPRIRFR